MKDMKEFFKSKKKISDNERDAKMGVLKEVSSMAGAAMGDKLKGLKKVSVASDSKEGLNKGLEKAKEMLNKDLAANDEVEPAHFEGGAEEGDAEGYPDEEQVGEDSDCEECPGCEKCIDAKLAELQAKKEKFSKE